MGGVAHAVGTARAIAQDEFNVLPCVILHHIVGRQLQLDPHHIMREFLQRHHAARHFFDGESAGFGDLLGFKHHIRQRFGAAREHIAIGLLFRRERFGLMRSMLNLTRELLAFAAAASAVFAAVGQANALADTGCEDALIRIDHKAAATGFDEDVERHKTIRDKYSSLQAPLCRQTKALSVPCPAASVNNAY